MKQPRAFGNLQRKASKQPTSEEMTGHEQSATYSSHELNFIPLEINEGELFSHLLTNPLRLSMNIHSS